jgi:hypothetical protein
VERGDAFKICRRNIRPNLPSQTVRNENRLFAITGSRAKRKSTCELTGTKCIHKRTTGYRLHYLNGEEAEKLIGETKRAFACLHGLIRAVEKETGKIGKMIAVATSIFSLYMVRGP